METPSEAETGRNGPVAKRDAKTRGATLRRASSRFIAGFSVVVVQAHHSATPTNVMPARAVVAGGVPSPPSPVGARQLTQPGNRVSPANGQGKTPFVKTESSPRDFNVQPAFVKNVGQFDDGALYHLSLAAYDVWVTEQGLMFDAGRSGPQQARSAGEPARDVFKTRFQDSSLTVVEANGLRPTLFNYFIGDDPVRWRTNVPSFSELTYRQVWPELT